MQDSNNKGKTGVLRLPEPSDMVEATGNHAALEPFPQALHKLIECYRKERRMDYATVVGSLTLQANALMAESMERGLGREE